MSDQTDNRFYREKPNATKLPLRSLLEQAIEDINDYDYDGAIRLIKMALLRATEQSNSDTPKPFLDAKALETLENFRKTIEIQREKGRPELADAIARLLPTIEGLFMRVQMYEERFGVMNPLQPSATVQAYRLTPEAYSRLLLLIGNASYTSTVPTQSDLEAALNG